ncbi:phage protein GemA/Gp16 family protein [Acidisoma sp. 7E03]
MSPKRRAMLAKAHIARKELFRSEDDYRAVLERVAGVTSAAACSDAQLDQVLTEFRRMGWKPKAARISHKPHVRMIYAVWNDLKAFVTVEDKDKALRAFVRRQTGKETPEFLTGAEANRVIEGLKSWLGRERQNARKSA